MLTIKDKNGYERYTRSDLGKTKGSHSTTWPANGTNSMNEQDPTNSPFIAWVKITKVCKGPSEDAGDACGEKIYIIGVEFEKKYAHYGFDDTVDPHWISAGVNEWKTHTESVITPAGVASEVDFSSDNTNIAIVGPSTASDSPQDIMAIGFAVGETAFKAKVDDGEAKTLNVAVYSTQTVKVTRWMIKDINGNWPTNVPSASALESGLKDIYEEQAYVVYTVTADSKTVDYDTNPEDGDLEVGDPNLSDEQVAIFESAFDQNADINTYYVVNLSDGVGVAYTVTAPEAEINFIQDSHLNSAVNLTAHEIGHNLDLVDVTINDRLMYDTESCENPCELIKTEWDDANDKAASF